MTTFLRKSVSDDWLKETFKGSLETVVTMTTLNYLSRMEMPFSLEPETWSTTLASRRWRRTEGSSGTRVKRMSSCVDSKASLKMTVTIMSEFWPKSLKNHSLFAELIPSNQDVETTGSTHIQVTLKLQEKWLEKGSARMTLIIIRLQSSPVVLE